MSDFNFDFSLGAIIGASVGALTGYAQGGGAAYSPASLFAASERGAWYDPSDFSTMYQDSAGTTSVTTVGQPVGLILDKRLGLVRGVELVTNGDFSSSTGWIGGAGVVISGGVATFTASSSFGALYRALNGTAVNELKAMEVTYTVASVSAGRVSVRMGGGGEGVWRSTVGTFTELITTNTSINANAVFYTDGFSGVIDNFSVKEISGNHAAQATSAARPVLAKPGVAYYRDFDLVDDAMVTTFPDLGTSVTIARSIPGTGASILTGQTIAAGAWSTSTDDCALVIINRALTGPETTSLTAYLNANAGV